jgi:hypothetical protein
LSAWQTFKPPTAVEANGRILTLLLRQLCPRLHLAFHLRQADFGTNWNFDERIGGFCVIPEVRPEPMAFAGRDPEIVPGRD